MKTGKNTAAAALAAGIVLTGILAAADSVSAAKITSEEQARQKALQKVPNASVTDIDLDREDGTQIYEIELVKGTKKYDLVYRVSDGKLLEYGWEKVSVSPAGSRSMISTDKCRKLALDKVKNGKITSISQKTDDGIDIYKVKMTAGNKLYTLKYHARTGALTECKWEIAVPASSGSDIGLEKAKQTALNEVPGASVYKAEADTDDGVRVYEIELVKGDYEYEFKIDAGTGKIIEQDRDRRD